jgi:peptidoglycan hydrolase-like amidase
MMECAAKEDKKVKVFLAQTALFAILSLMLLAFSVHLTKAECVNETDCQSQINQQSLQLSSIQSQQIALQGSLNSAARDLNSTQAQLNSYQVQANSIRAQLDGAQASLDSAQISLDKEKDLFKKRVRDLYEQGQVTSWELFFVGNRSFAEELEGLGLRQAVLTKNAELIMQYTDDVRKLSLARDQWESANKTAQGQLAQIQSIRNSQAVRYSSIASANNSMSSQIKKINSTIKNLTTQQQQIIAAKLAATSQSTTVGNSAPASSDPGPSPYAGGFLFLNYGYPHRIGMNQYGAFGRAKVGQNYQQILQAYYGQTGVTVGNEPAIISTDQGTKNFETDYMYGIAEMPTYWADQGGYEALKAQAVAARSYALASMGWPNSNNTVCTSQSCQVYNASKVSDPAGARWRQAVDDTKGQILTSGSGARSAYYSTTDGGYTCVDFAHNDPCTRYLVDASGGWSPSTAYDGPNFGNSPWFHKAWGTYNGTAWLSPIDTADIFNAAILSSYSSSYNQYLSPQTSGGWGYSRVVQELQAKGLPWIDQASAVGVGMDGSGNTNAISVVGHNGTAKMFDGQQFRAIFDLRSPGTLTIFWSSLYDVQKS